MNDRAARSTSLALLLALGAGWTLAGEETIQLREAPGRETTTAFCSACHSLDYIEMNARVFDRTGWDKSVRKMIERFGAPIPEEDAQRIIAYLAEHY
jgi:hypothetical protein